MHRIALLGFVAVMLSSVAHGQPLSCSANVSSVNIRAGAGSELLPDVVLSCTGGVPTPVGQAVPTPTFSIFLNAPAASRRLLGGQSVWSDALLLVDEPPAASQLACTSGASCTTTGTPGGASTYNGTAGRPNVFQGGFASQNQLAWVLPADPPGSGKTRTFRFTNLRVNTSGLSSGAQIFVVVAAGSFTPSNSTLVAATVQTGISADAREPVSAGNRITSFKVHLSENAVNIFKPRTSIGPAPTNQNVPGSPPLYETGFRNSAFPVTPQGDLSVAGLADTGTRVVVRLNAVPAGVTVTLPTVILFGLFGEGSAHLVITDSLGGGAYTPAATGTLAPDNSGNITAVYEFTQSLSGAPEIFEVPYTVNYGAGAPASLLQFSGSVGLAPLSNTIPSFDATQFIQFQTNVPPSGGPVSITTNSPLPPGSVGNPYATTIAAKGGTQPYSFFFSGNPPPGFSLSVDGILSGTPSIAGTFDFAILVQDAANSSVIKAFTVTVTPQSSIFQLSSAQLTFNAALGGGKPPIQSLTVQSIVQQAVNFTVATDGGSPNLPAPAWLTVLFSSTTAPYRATVSVDQSNLTAGTYRARILIGEAGNTGQPALVVTVTLNVAALPQRLSVFPDLLKFVDQINSPSTHSRNVLLFNSGGGGPIQFTASVLKQSPWIKAVTPSQGSAGALNPASVRVDVDTTGVPVGFQRDVIRFTWAGGKTDLPVVLFVAPGGAFMHLGRTGVYFRANAGSSNVQTQQVRIFDVDRSSVISWNATILSGNEWLALNPSSGSSTFSDPGWVTLGVKPAAASLPVGPRYALVKVDALNTIHAPQYIVAVLDIQDGDTTSGLDFDDGGAVLTATTGSTQTMSHVFNITTGSRKGVAFNAAIAAANGANIFSISPASGVVTSTAPTPVTISANPTGLAAGVYTAEIAVATPARVETLAVTMIVADAPTGGTIPAGARAAGCVRSSLTATQIGLTNSFSVPAGWPTALVVDLRDNCGAQVTNGVVVASFSNGDPPLSLNGDNTSGLYSATWQPVAQVNPMTITIHAGTSDLSEVLIPLTGGIVANPVPVLFQNGTVNNLDPKLGGPLSPGLVAGVYGGNMATVIESTPAGALPPAYKGTQMLMGPYAAPIYFVSPGQLDVQVPFELSPNLPYSVVVSFNGAYTIPDTVAMVPAVPGVAVNADGSVIAQYSDYAAHPPFPYVVTPTDPANRGDYLVIYLVGLGVTNPAVASGAQSPAAEPFGRPATPVTMTLGGAPLSPLFVGLTPFAVGLYQINFQVPLNAPLNTPLDLVITQNGLVANSSTLTIAP